MKRILIVEDEAAIRELEAINLKRVGYETVEHFNRLFKKIYNMTPSQFQREGR